MGLPKSKISVVIVATAVTLILVAIGLSALSNSPKWKFSQAYRQLKLGITQDDVRELFGDTPDFDCRLGGSTIWYYRAPGFLAGTFDDVDLPRGATVPSTSDLPDVYDHVQLAFDSNGRLHSYTWIGETNTVETTRGSVAGSHFKQLENSGF